jgi:hypothetical protein
MSSSITPAFLKSWKVASRRQARRRGRAHKPVPVAQIRIEVGLGQHQRVRSAAAAGLVAHGQLGGVDRCVDVSAALLGKWPFEHLGRRVAEETGEHAAQLTGAVAGRLDRPVALLALRESEAGSKPIGAVAGEDVEARGAAQLRRKRRRGMERLHEAGHQLVAARLAESDQLVAELRGAKQGDAAKHGG